MGAAAISMRLFLIVSIILRINIFQHHKFNTMISYFEEIDSIIRSKQFLTKSFYVKSEYLQFKAVVVYILFFTLFIMVGFVLTSDYLLSILQVFSDLYVFIINTVNWSILKDVCVRLDTLNVFLKEFINNKRSLLFLELGKIGKLNAKLYAKHKQNDVITWIKIHILVNKIVAIYNELFGWFMFIFVLYVMLMVLTLLQRFLFTPFELGWQSGFLCALILFQIVISFD